MGTVLLVRHGQASFGADDYDVLSPRGWEQGRALGGFLARTGPPDAWVRGGLRRHRETLEAVLDGAGGSDVPVDVDPGWDEFDHVGIVATHPALPPGDLDRRAFQEVFELATADWIADAHPGLGDAETWSDFTDRVLDALVAVTEAAGPGRTLGVVTSGGVIALAAAHLLDPDAVDDADPERLGRVWSRLNTVTVNAAVTRLVVGSTGARLLAFNEHSFLAAEQRTYR